ncbi:MAG TPA: hypothetical protein VHM27_04635 [Rhizomicrobium sp.]|nr:hypothetical protein [Rhizomicrobium sp.]
MRKDRRLFSFLAAACIWLMPVSAMAADALSPAQMAVVTRQIVQLKYPPERALASAWSDAKKVAEFICRPLAMTVLKQRFKGADRVFLGDDKPQSLQLAGDHQLTGYGQVRIPTGWRTFDFSCALDPKSGKVLGFEPRFPSGTRAP